MKNQILILTFLGKKFEIVNVAISGGGEAFNVLYWDETAMENRILSMGQLEFRTMVDWE